jgi:hypothetical protein
MKGLRPSFLEIFKSVFTALIGVQSSRVHERDFTQGQPSSYIIVSITVVTFIVLVLVGLVQLILHLTGS